MDDSNNHYMKLISPSNNKTLVTPEKSQNYDPENVTRDLRTLGEANKDETARREGDRGKKKKRERNEKGKGRTESRRGQEREMRDDREQRARVIGQRMAPLSSSARRPPSRRARRGAAGVRRSVARTLCGATNGKRGAARRGAFVYLSPCNASGSRSVTRAVHGA